MWHGILNDSEDTIPVNLHRKKTLMRPLLTDHHLNDRRVASNLATLNFPSDDET